MTGQMTHPDPDVLAEFRAGLITGRRGTKVAAHLADCERCSALSDQLAEVSALLAAVPAPAMPDGVARRLETVLAAEVAQKDDSERAAGDSSRDRAGHRRPARHRGWRLVAVRVLAPAAAIVVLAAGGYGLSRLAGGPTSPAASGAAARPTADHPAEKTIIGSTPGAASRAEIPAIGASGLLVINSRTDYQRATLSRQLEQEISASSTARTAQSPSTRLLGCVYRVIGGVSPGARVLVVNARYQGQPATIIVAPGDGGYVAWVMTSGCSATTGRVLDKVRLQGTSAP
jgi:hypothetical protein